MAAPASRKIVLWVVIAAAASAVLTWVERAEHHPPNLAVIAAIHFVFMLAAVALAAGVWRIVRRRG